MTDRNMTGEQFLNSIRYLDYEITALDRERVRMQNQRIDILESAESLGANPSGMCVQHEVSSKTETLGIALASEPDIKTLVTKLNEYQNRINRKIDELVDCKQKALGFIEKIADGKYRALLSLRYLSNLRWATISGLMGYSDTYVRLTLKEEAIVEFEEIWKEL